MPIYLRPTYSLINLDQAILYKNLLSHYNHKFKLERGSHWYPKQYHVKTTIQKEQKYKKPKVKNCENKNNKITKHEK